MAARRLEGVKVALSALICGSLLLGWAVAGPSTTGLAAEQPAGASPAGAHLAARADLILVNGRVLTQDATDSVVEAIAIAGSRIVATGTSRLVLGYKGVGTRVIDLQGRAVTPGLIDSHAHVAYGGHAELFELPLENAKSISDIARLIRERVATMKPGQWLVGNGWDEGKLADHRYVYASDIDAVASHNPVWLNHTTGHYGVANSYALRLAGIKSATKDPSDGRIDRDAGGNATGVLKESASEIVTRLIPAPSPKQLSLGISRVLHQMHREGMTGFKDPDINQVTWNAYRILADAGQLPAHVCVLWNAGTTVASMRNALSTIEGIPATMQLRGTSNLRSCGVKLYMDGSGGARTAWLYGDWNKDSSGIDSGNTGFPAIDPQVYREQVRIAHAAGVPIGTHAIGDRAIDWALDTYEAVLREMPTQGLRHSIIHANIPTDHAITSMAALEKSYDAGYPEVQPTFMWWIGDTYAGNFGTARSARLLPLRTFTTKGVTWAGGSDYNVTPIPARIGIWASVVRKSSRALYGEHPFGTIESVDAHTALRAYTTSNARQMFLEDRIGSIEVGKDADIAVWDRNPYAITGEALKDMKCEMTIFAGKVVFTSASFGGAAGKN